MKSLKKRTSDNHSFVQQYNCEICNETFAEKKQLKKHRAVHKTKPLNVCNVCSKSFSHKGSLKMHLNTHLKVKPYKCDVCSRTFSQNVCLQIHLRTHTNEKPYVCEQCSKAFSIKRYLERHLAVHRGDRPYTCNICSKSFPRKITLKNHMITHLGVKLYKCELCTMSFTTKRSLDHHLMSHMGETYKPHACPMCAKSFKHKKGLMNHLLTHTGEKPHVCDTCNKAFALKSSLKHHHLKEHAIGFRKPHVCHICKKAFFRNTDLMRHSFIHMNEKRKRPHSCTICEKSFTRKIDLVRHYSLHSRKRTHSCEKCGKSFTYMTHLRNHILTHSPKSNDQKINREKSFKCTLCNKAFLKAFGLKKHALTHTNVKPYACDVCNKSFLRKRDLQVHGIVHTGIKPFVCDICNKGYYQKSRLVNHKLHYHEVTAEQMTQSESVVCQKIFNTESTPELALTHDERNHQVSDLDQQKCIEANLNGHSLAVGVIPNDLQNLNTNKNLPNIKRKTVSALENDSVALLNEKECVITNPDKAELGSILSEDTLSLKRELTDSNLENKIQFIEKKSVNEGENIGLSIHSKPGDNTCKKDIDFDAICEGKENISFAEKLHYSTENTSVREQLIPKAQQFYSDGNTVGLCQTVSWSTVSNLESHACLNSETDTPIKLLNYNDCDKNFPICNDLKTNHKNSAESLQDFTGELPLKIYPGALLLQEEAVKQGFANVTKNNTVNNVRLAQPASHAILNPCSITTRSLSPIQLSSDSTFELFKCVQCKDKLY